MIELCCKYLPVRCIWWYVLLMSRTSPRVNPHSIIAWISRNSLLEAGVKVSFGLWILVWWFCGLWVVVRDCGFESSCSHLNFNFCACVKQGVPWHSGNYRLRLTLKRVRYMTGTYSQMHCTDKYSQHSSIIWSVWLNGWVFVYELSGCGFEFSCGNLNFKLHACFKEGVHWHSGNYRELIHSQTLTWYDENI